MRPVSRSLFFLIFFAPALVQGATRKPADSVEGLKQEVERLLKRDRFEEVVQTVLQHGSNLPGDYRNQSLITAYRALSRTNAWKETLESLPAGPSRELQFAEYWSTFKSFNQAMAHVHEAFELGMKAEDLPYKKVKLLSGDLAVPPYWFLTYKPRDTGREFFKNYTFLLPYGAQFQFYIADGTLSATSVESVSRWVRSYSRRFPEGAEVKEYGFKPVHNSFRGVLKSTKGGFADPESVLVVVANTDAKTLYKTCHGILLPDRGVDYENYEFNRTGGFFSFSWYTGGKEEVFFMNDFERFLDSLIRR